MRKIINLIGTFKNRLTVLGKISVIRLFHTYTYLNVIKNKYYYMLYGQQLGHSQNCIPI